MFRERIQKAVMSIIGIACCVGYTLTPLSLYSIEYNVCPQFVIQTNVSSPICECNPLSSREYISEEKPDIQQVNIESELNEPSSEDAHYTVPNSNTDFKSYTFYTSLRTPNTPQKRLQAIAYTDENGVRKVEEYYCCAVGTYYSNTIGDLFEVTTDCGNIFKIIVCDTKSDIHTDSTHRITIHDGSMLEFYVDHTLNSYVKKCGTLSVLPQFKGNITSITYIGHYDF